MKKDKIGVYIHIPFCVRKCRYCGFLSFPGYPEEMYESFTEAAVRELKNFNEGFVGKYEADTVFIGGGTPSLLSGEQIGRLLDAVRDTFGISGSGAAGAVAGPAEKAEMPVFAGKAQKAEMSEFARKAQKAEMARMPEITMEANPNSLTAGKLAEYRAAGVSRLSMGAQSFSDRVLDSLGRVHKAADIERAFAEARAAGFGNINLDLMFAVPDQTMDDVMDSVKRAAELGPEHISLYGLQLEEDTIFYEEYKSGMLDLPDEEKEREMYMAAVKALKEAGYAHYEISNFAKPGYECRHNLKYWEMGGYVGLGPGAHSYIGGERRKNVDSLEDYLELTGEGRSATEPGSRAMDTRRDAMAVFVFTGLRKLEGIDLKEFENRFGEEFFGVYKEKADVIKEYMDRGLMKLSGSRLSITEKGIYISNDIMSEFV